MIEINWIDQIGETKNGINKCYAPTFKYYININYNQLFIFFHFYRTFLRYMSIWYAIDSKMLIFWSMKIRNPLDFLGQFFLCYKEWFTVRVQRLVLCFNKPLVVSSYFSWNFLVIFSVKLSPSYSWGLEPKINCQNNSINANNLIDFDEAQKSVGWNTSGYSNGWES